MLPPVLLTRMRPSTRSHLTGWWSETLTHSSRLLPSKRAMASEGAAPKVSPGVTTGGTGFQISVSSGFACAFLGSCAERVMAAEANAAKARVLRMGEFFIVCECTEKQGPGTRDQGPEKQGGRDKRTKWQSCRVEGGGVWT